MIRHGMRWPIAVLDFEASALDDESYPIEVGIAIWMDPESPIGTWSSLIEPTCEWVRDGVWFWEAQKIHGIAPGDLVGAPYAATVMARLNDLLGPVGSAISDNPQWETGWLARLSIAAGMKPAFAVDGVRARLEAIDPEMRRRIVDHMKRNPAPHRAGPDAQGFVEAIAHGMGVETTIRAL